VRHKIAASAASQPIPISQFVVGKLKKELKRELYHPPRLRRLNLPHVRAVHVVHRNAKIRVIENVEEFRAELQALRFREPEIFQR
jgi:hypothetical protein